MEKVNIIESQAVPLEIENVDTDQIIPARFLKATSRTGFGENLFRDWRFDTKGQPKPGFILNNPEWKGNILITGKNFGSGSSREHAAWALYDYGFMAVVSSFFADIFANNALNNGLLTVQVPDAFLKELFTVLKADPGIKIRIDLPNQEISVPGKNLVSNFPVNSFKKKCLIEGIDDIEYLLSLKQEILDFEKRASGIS